MKRLRSPVIRGKGCPPDCRSVTSWSLFPSAGCRRRGASDVHLKLGQPPVVRLDGDLEPLPERRC